MIREHTHIGLCIAMHNSISMQRLETACLRINSGDYRSALQELLWCFDCGCDVDPHFAAVRLSFVLGYIESLFPHLPQALDELHKRWSATQKDVAGEWNDSNVRSKLCKMQDFVALSKSCSLQSDAIMFLMAFDENTIRLQLPRKQMVREIIARQVVSLRGESTSDGAGGTS